MFLDHPNRRVRKVTPSATHIYHYDGWNLDLAKVGLDENFDYFRTHDHTFTIE